MNRRLLLSAFAMMALLSCQNQSAAPSAPQGETGTLALRVVSAQALEPVDSVSVRLSWGDDISIYRKAVWDAPSIKLDGLPLGVRIAVRMVGWNDERGRTVVAWSGDAYVQLSGDVDWDMNHEAPIVIVPAAPPSSPNLAALLPVGHVLVGDSLRLLLGVGKADTIRLGATGVDSVLLDDKNLVAVDGKFPIELAPGARHQVVVVGTNGLTSSFRVVALAKLPAARELVVANDARSWSNDTLSSFLPAGASDTIRIGTKGVDSVRVNGSRVLPEGDTYRIVVKAPSRDSVVIMGAAGQSARFCIVVQAIQNAEVKPGLVVDFRPSLPIWVGAICSMRVAMDSGKVDSVVMLKPQHIAFDKKTDSLWSLEWKTTETSTSDSVEVHVYGRGSGGPDSVMLGKRLSFDRKAPTISVAGLTDKGFLFGKAGGVVSWRASDRGDATTWASDAGDANVVCVGDTCMATGVKRSFTIHARDNLGNDTSLAVPVTIDDAGPTINSVKDASGKDLKIGDTLWIDSAVGSGAVLVAATDDHSGIVIVAERGVPQAAIQEGVSAGNATIQGLTVGTWTLRSNDDLGNGTPWGNLEVAIRKPGADVSLGAVLNPLPKWVAASCSVKVVGSTGTIDTVLASGTRFRPNGNRTIWSAIWEPVKNSGLDTLSINVRGQGSKGLDSILLLGIVSVDRKGPEIALKSRTRDGALRVGRNGGELAISVRDDRGIESVWLADGGKIAKADGDSLYRAVVTNSVTIKARDSLGNIGSREVVVVRDTIAPSDIEVQDGLGNKLAVGGDVRHDTTGDARLVVKAIDSSGFLVRIMNGDVEVRREAASNGEAVFDNMSAGVYAVVIEDSLGNNETWGDVVVRIRPPALGLLSGTYGADATKYITINSVDSIDVLYFAAKCPEGGRLFIKDHAQTAPSAWEENWLYAFNSSISDFRCIKGSAPTDTSEIVRRAYEVLQRPAIQMPDSAYDGDSLSVVIKRDPGTIATNPSGATIEYRLGTDSAGLQWLAYKNPVVVKGTQTLWARVTFNDKHSSVVKRTYTKVEKGVAWKRDFGLASAPMAKDTAELRSSYQIHGWSAFEFDTLAAAVGGSTSPGALRLSMKWQTVERPAGSWGAFGAEFFLDGDYSVYDFTDADSIVFDYSGAGTMNLLRIYPVSDLEPGNNWNALQYEVKVTSSSTSRHMRIKLGNDGLEYPLGGDSTEQLYTWNDIKGAIRALRFSVEPNSGSDAVPYAAMTSLSISKVAIYGSIRKVK